MYRVYMDSKVGLLEIIADEQAILQIAFCDEKQEDHPNELCLSCVAQLEEYFQGKRETFTLPLEPKGTPFQRKVWQALCEIPYGETRSYQDIAISVGSPAACRAVGLSNNRNPIVILIPCHRVIGKNGRMVGYGGGLDKKEVLLTLEQQNR